MRRIVSLSVGVALLTFGLYLQPTTATAGGGGLVGALSIRPVRPPMMLTVHSSFLLVLTALVIVRCCVPSG